MSKAKDVWDTECTGRLDQLERIHADARGTRRGRRWETEQLNRSLFVALVGQFQVYCRELHDEAISNAVVHGNESEVHSLTRKRPIAATLRSYHLFRSTCDRLVRRLDAVVAAELAAELQISQPW